MYFHLSYDPNFLLCIRGGQRGESLTLSRFIEVYLFFCSVSSQFYT